MSRQTAFGLLVVFTLSVAGGVIIGDRTSAADAAQQALASRVPSTTSPPEPVAATFLQPNETVVGAAVVVASDMRLDGEQVVIDFELHNLAPVAEAAAVVRSRGFGSFEEILPEDLDTVFLDRWVLVTAAGDIPGSVANPAARTARFDVGPGFLLASVTEVRLASYALLTPVDVEFALGLGSDRATIAPGITARLLAVTEQAVTIVQVEILSERDFNYDKIIVTGSGPGWKSGVREAEGRPRWNLTYDAESAPAPIPLRLSGSIWVPVDNDSVVLVEAAP